MGEEKISFWQVVSKQCQEEFLDMLLFHSPENCLVSESSGKRTNPKTLSFPVLEPGRAIFCCVSVPAPRYVSRHLMLGRWQ